MEDIFGFFWDILSQIFSQILLEFFFGTTGYILVAIVTLGRGSVTSGTAMLVGAFFWMFIIVLTVLDPGIWHHAAYTLHLVAR